MSRPEPRSHLVEISPIVNVNFGDRISLAILVIVLGTAAFSLAKSSLSLQKETRLEMLKIKNEQSAIRTKQANMESQHKNFTDYDKQVVKSLESMKRLIEARTEQSK